MASAKVRYSAAHWHQRAEEVAAKVQAMEDADARRTMVAIAMMYSQLALRVETRNAERAINQAPCVAG